MPRLERNWEVFSELRDVLRVQDDEVPRGSRRSLSARSFPASAAARLQEIETNAKADHEDLRRRIAAHRANGAHPLGPLPETVVLDYLDRYSDGLFGRPVALDHAGKIIAVVERTNNVAEHFSGVSKQNLRRRLGRAQLGRDMQDQPAQAALAANLQHADYVRIVCGTPEQLPQAFAELDRQGVDETNPLQRNERDTALRKRIRAWVADDESRFPRAPENCPHQRSELRANN